VVGTTDEEVKSMRDAFGEALVELGQHNPDVVVLDADLAHSTRTALFAREFPDRFLNVGIAECNMVSIGAGLATAGVIPFVSTFSFLLTLRAGEQVRTGIAYPKLNVKLCGAYAGLSDSYDGATHQDVMDLAVMRAMPNMVVVAPADDLQTRKAVFAAAERTGPVYLRLSRAEAPRTTSEDAPFEIGKAQVLREGSDVALISTGTTLHLALDAADKLGEGGTHARVINMHTIKPLDENAVIAAARETHGIVTIEEHSIIGGLGGAVAEVLARSCPTPIQMVGIEDAFAESGGYQELLTRYGLTVYSVCEKAKRVVRPDKAQGRKHG